MSPKVNALPITWADPSLYIGIEFAEGHCGLPVLRLFVRFLLFAVHGLIITTIGMLFRMAQTKEPVRVLTLVKDIVPEFLDTINYAICQTANEYLGEETPKFFGKVGEYHLEEALKRGFIKLDPSDKPLNNLITIAKYLESTGYMEKIRVDRLGESEAIVEMFGVAVTKSSADLLKAGKHPSHYMTNIMLAALRKLGIQAELRDVEYDEKQRHFKEHWKIL